MKKRFKVMIRGIAAVMVLLAVYLTLVKGHTMPIFSVNGHSIAEYETVELGGVRQSILIRGENTENPVLLYLHGGPGNPETSFITKYQREWEKYFTVVNWDQRGSGKSYHSNIEIDTLDIQHTLDDTIELTEYLRKKFGMPKIYLVGHSWGTYVGMLAAKQHPESYYAYIGVGQVADQQANEFEIRDYALKRAAAEGNDKAIRDMEAIGEPPYSRNDFADKISVNRKWSTYYGGSLWGYTNTRRFNREALYGLEYNLFDFIHYLKGDHLYYSIDSQARWDLYQANLIRDIPEIKIPVYFCQGVHDNITSYKLAKTYYEQLKAPLKRFETFTYSAHLPILEEQDKFSDYLINTVLPETFK